MLTRKRLAARLASNWDLRLSLQTLAELGLGGTVLEAMGELAPRSLSQTGRREVRALLRSADLELIGLALPMRRSIDERTDWDARLSRLAEAMNLAYELGTRLVCLSPGVAPDADSKGSLFADHLSQLAALAEHHGVMIALESGLESASQLVQTVKSINDPSLRICFDPGRLALSGQNAENVVSEVHNLLSLVYTTDPEFMGMGNLGRGKVVEWPNVMDLLEEAGYRDFLTIWPDATLPVAQVVPEMGRRLGATPHFF